MTYVISDIHGEYKLLIKLLEKIQFSNDDYLLVLGDMIDKGLESIKVLKFLYSLPNAKCILGNHEYDFLKVYWTCLQQGNVDFDELIKKLQNYFIDDTETLDWDIIDWLEGLASYIEGENYIGVHSGVPIDNDGKIKPLKDATVEDLVYDRAFKDNVDISPTEKCVFFGHTPVSYITGKDEIILYPKTNRVYGLNDLQKVHLDTGVYLNGTLGCFCLDTLKTYYVK